jgi:hypothetical protein
VTPSSDDQLEFFPARVSIDRLDPRKVVGARSQADALYRVRIGDRSPAHLVFVDRHGVYCQDHGAECRAAREVRQRMDDGGPAQRGLGL